MEFAYNDVSGIAGMSEVEWRGTGILISMLPSSLAVQFLCPDNMQKSILEVLLSSLGMTVIPGSQKAFSMVPSISWAAAAHFFLSSEPLHVAEENGPSYSKSKISS